MKNTDSKWPVFKRGGGQKEGGGGGRRVDEPVLAVLSVGDRISAQTVGRLELVRARVVGQLAAVKGGEDEDAAGAEARERRGGERLRAHLVVEPQEATARVLADDERLGESPCDEDGRWRRLLEGGGGWWRGGGGGRWGGGFIRKGLLGC